MTLDQLATLQERFVRALDADSAASVLPDGWCNGHGDDWQRFSRYRKGLWQHQVQSLGLTFPVLTALVGEDFLRTLAYDFGRVHPSRHPDLSLFGEHLPGFLTHYPAARDYPYFAEIAALEWAVHCSARTEEIVALSALDLAVLKPEQIDGRRLSLHAGCALLHSEWPIAALWQAHVEHAQVLPALQSGSYVTLVYRQGWHARVRPVSPWEAAALSLFIAGATLGEALLAAQAQWATTRPAAATALIDSAALLSRWLGEALLIATED
ncbi:MULTISPECIES: HvfC/BufC N-terminal domain-containing protein [unclassified Pseudomonas]|jgi:hypothetical protein|uniref:HvfC/BufC N-terminal domain-containing protein n=1 Tax=unclassified Pseudomonas TaxID=196821 RepID=UPI00131FF1B4|nr:DNA-binding domain-containing protein [Pseudomonas sp. R84]QHC97660.1 hypothetical protein PspR84_24480 [Pseudomonas sp. R84]